MLCEVAFTEWTQDGRIRHPSFQGLREDKEARDVKQETPEKTAAAAKPAAQKSKAERLVLDGVTITHPDRVISETGQSPRANWPNITPRVAPFMLPGSSAVRSACCAARRASMASASFSAIPGRGLGADVKPFEFRHKGKKYEYLYIEDEKGLLEVIQMGAIEMHPWGAPVDAIDYPDRMIFDLDPGAGCAVRGGEAGGAGSAPAAQAKGLESVLKCTGGKGLHVTVPLAGKDKWPAVKAFAASLAEEMVADDARGLCRHDEQGEADRQNLYRLLPQRLYGHGHRRLRRPRAAGRAGGPAVGVERTQRPDIGQPVHDEGRAGARER